MVRIAKPSRRISLKNNPKRPPSLYVGALFLVTILTSLLLISTVISDITTPTNPQGSCGHDAAGNATYISPTYHHPARDIVYVLLFFGIMMLMLGLYKFKGKVYKAIVFITVLGIGIGASMFMLAETLGAIAGGIGCVPF